MHELAEAVAKICHQKPKYAFDAYFFVFEALNYAHKTLGLGQVDSDSIDMEEDTSDVDEAQAAERHLTGQQLCEAIRLYALEQYGYMAKCVLNNWGIEKTDDFGEIVFNLIDADQMRKTPDDKREDFNDNFDFDVGLCQSFKISITE